MSGVAGPAESGSSDGSDESDRLHTDRTGGATGGDGLRTADSLEFAVPPGSQPRECRHCGRPFADERSLALHRGLAHEKELSAEERAAFETARDEEQAAVRRYRLKAAGGVVLLYFLFLMLYAVV